MVYCIIKGTRKDCIIQLAKKGCTVKMKDIVLMSPDKYSTSISDTNC